MRLLFSLAVVAFTTASSQWGFVIGAEDKKNVNGMYNERRNRQRRGHKEFLRRKEMAVMPPADPLVDGATGTNSAPSDPLPEYMQNQKMPILAPPDVIPDNSSEQEMLPIHAPEEPMPDHLKSDKVAIMATADSVPPVKKTLKCVLMEAIYLFAPGFEPAEGEEERHEWQCEFHDFDNAILTLKGISPNFYARHENKIKSGETILSITYDEGSEDPNFDVLTTDIFRIPRGSTLALSDAPRGEEGFRQRRRTEILPEGNHTLLVIRVSDIFGNRPESTATQLSDDIFGTVDDEHNLKSQYKACSGGKLDFIPADGENIVNGVVELQIPAELRFQSSSVVENWVLRLAPESLGPLDQWTFVMFILPDTVNFSGAAAYTYLHSRHSVFLNQFSSNLLVLMHEIGHMLGNKHSGKGTLSYDDGTCMMGAHVYEDDAPRMCFNGAKSYYLGWYEDAQVDIDPTKGSWMGELVGVDDYVSGSIKDDGSQNVVVRIPSSASPDLFLIYNRKKGINSQVTMNADDVTVVQQQGPSGQSWLLAGLSERDNAFRFDDWDGKDTVLVIDVCSQKYGPPDTAEVLIYLEDGTETPSCPSLPSSATDGIQEGPKTIAASVAQVASKTVELSISSTQNVYRERDDGTVRTVSDVETLFGPNWNMLGFRFESSADSSIPNGVEIESAVLLVHPIDKLKFLKRAMYGQAVGHAVGDASRIKRASNFITKAPKTQAVSDVGPGIPAWKPGRYEQLVDVTPVLQEVVGQTEYNQGNSIEIFLMGDAGTSGRRILTPEQGKGPILRVKYKDGGSLKKSKQTIQEKETWLEITDNRDDCVETSSGAIRPTSKTHLLWTPGLPRYAYRFRQVPVPSGARVLEARLEFFGTRRASMKADISGIIQGEDVADSPPFTNEEFELKYAEKTAATVVVNDLPPWKVNQYNTIGDVTSIVQEIVNKDEYSNGNAIKFILTNKGSPSTRRVRTHQSGNGARLFIRYEDS